MSNLTAPFYPTNTSLKPIGKLNESLSSLGRSLHVLLSLLQSLLQSVESQLQVLVAVAGEHHAEPSRLLGEERLSLHITIPRNDPQGR